MGNDKSRKFAKLIIEKCYITLDDILDEKGDSIKIDGQRRLSWRQGEGTNKNYPVNEQLNIVKGEPRVCDLASTDFKFDRIAFSTWSGFSNHIPIGMYTIYITVFGEWQKHQLNEPYSLILNYEGRNNLLISDIKKRKKGKDNQSKE